MLTTSKVQKRQDGKPEPVEAGVGFKTPPDAKAVRPSRFSGVRERRVMHTVRHRNERARRHTGPCGRTNTPKVKKALGGVFLTPKLRSYGEGDGKFPLIVTMIKARRERALRLLPILSHVKGVEVSPLISEGH